MNSPFTEFMREDNAATESLLGPSFETPFVENDPSSRFSRRRGEQGYEQYEAAMADPGQYETEDLYYEDEVKDTQEAIRLNRQYASRLGWDKFQIDINELMLPYSGQQNVSLAEDAFAHAVAVWQSQNGLSSDGIIGPNTWAKLKSQLGTPGNTTASPSVSSTSSSVNSNVVSNITRFNTEIERASNSYSISPNIVRGIIAAESAGNPDSGKGKTGYKGLMQAERTVDQLTPQTSIETGVKKFIAFRDKTLNPWFTRLQIPQPSATDENYLKACLSCYNAGPVTALKAIQYAHTAGNWRNWLLPEYYQRALLFSGGYARYSACNQGVAAVEIDKASAERLKYRFKTAGWRNEPDPPEWNAIQSSLHPVLRCWIETKYRNTPGYLNRFIAYMQYFDRVMPVNEMQDTEFGWGQSDNLENEDNSDYETIGFIDQEISVEDSLKLLYPGDVANRVRQMLMDGTFKPTLLEEFASGQVWNEDYLALEVLYVKNPSLRPSSLDTASETDRLKILRAQMLKHKTLLAPIVSGIIRPVFGNPSNFQVGQHAPCNIIDLRKEVTAQGRLKGGEINGRTWYKKDERLTPRSTAKIDCIVLHHMAFNRGNDVNSYKTVGAQYAVLADGKITQLYNDTDYLNSSNGFNSRCIAIEFAGNFPPFNYKWWASGGNTPSRCYLTPAQARAGRSLLAELKGRFPGIKYLYAHRQSSSNKLEDPGPDVWFTIGEWAITTLGLTDLLPQPKTGTGSPIPSQWRIARQSVFPSATTTKEYQEETDQVYETGFDESELQQYEYDDENFRDEAGSEDIHDHEEEEYDYEAGIEELVSQWTRAAELNRRYAQQLGWGQMMNQVNDFLLPYSGMQNVSLGEEELARAAAAWQQSLGLVADGIIGPNTWAKMKPLLNNIAPSQPTPAVISQYAPSPQNIFAFNQWHAQKILDTINAGIVSVNRNLTYDPKVQLEQIVLGRKVLSADPQTRILQVLPVLYHICDHARVNNNTDIVIGSFIRAPQSNGVCEGHCAGRAIDINFKGGSFALQAAARMVITILSYLHTIGPVYNKDLRFGLPFQGVFFGNNSLPKFRRTSPSNIIDPTIARLIAPLGMVFPDNDNHMHVQVKWM